MKGYWRNSGLTQNEKLLDKYFLIAPELSNVQHEFDNHYCTGNLSKRAELRELRGEKVSQITKKYS